MFRESPFGISFDDDLPDSHAADDFQRQPVLDSGQESGDTGETGWSQDFTFGDHSHPFAPSFEAEPDARASTAGASSADASISLSFPTDRSAERTFEAPHASMESQNSLATVVAATRFGNDYVDGILWGTKWTGSLTYSFADNLLDFGSPYPHTIGGLQPVTAMQQAATRAIFGGAS